MTLYLHGGLPHNVTCVMGLAGSNRPQCSCTAPFHSNSSWDSFPYIANAVNTAVTSTYTLLHMQR